MMLPRVGLGIFLTSTDATRRETSALLSLSNDEENSGLPQDRLAFGFECSRDISDSSNLRPRTSSPPAKGLILRASALETHSAGPHSSRQPPHNNGTLKPEA